jgi:autotransporter strand-loop-strand O-heptosyltransferase
MKIINVTPGLIPIPPNGWGAVEKIIWEIHNCLLKLGHDSTIAYLDDVNDYDIVHIHVANLANLAHERGIPYYFTMHDHHAYLYGKDSSSYKENLKAIKNAKKAFVPAKFLVDYFEGIPEYFSHGVNTDYFTPTGVKEHRLLCVANNGFIHDQSEDRKGFSYAIEAAKQLDLPITIAGPSNNKKYFEKFPPDYDKLTILYDLTEDELRDLYKEHSIFVHASILEAGHPNLTLLEAMASRLPVVGTYEDNNELKGLIKVERNTDQIVEAVSKLISPIKYLRYSKLAKTTALELSWMNRTKELLKKYSNTMKDQLIQGYESTNILAIPSKEPVPQFNINFIQAAFFEIVGGKQLDYDVSFINNKTNEVLHSGKISSNCWIKASKQSFVDWKIKAFDGIHEYEYNLDLKDKRVYIALDSKSLGDTLAWFPYVEEFQKKHNCKIITSTFWNHFFEKEYPNFEFAKPGEAVNNLYAMYTIGWFYNEDGTIDYNKNPKDFKHIPLQQTASDILGLEYKELRPRITVDKSIKKEKIISIAVHSTAQAKYWNNKTGWQKVVDYLKKEGYKVVLVSREEDGYMGNKNPIGVEYMKDNSMETTIETIQKSQMFIGISSGLSWLSWALGTKTCVISGFSDPITEFEDAIRLYTKDGFCKGCFNTHQLDPGDWNWCPKHKGTQRQFECSKTISGEEVIKAISLHLNNS